MSGKTNRIEELKDTVRKLKSEIDKLKKEKEKTFEEFLNKSNEELMIEWNKEHKEIFIELDNLKRANESLQAEVKKLSEKGE